jgi:hypothetical protein
LHVRASRTGRVLGAFTRERDARRNEVADQT